jgi:hypothetical protein
LGKGKGKRIGKDAIFYNQAISPRVEAFLYALLRLRDSSGAGFLTILIAGSSLHYKLRKERLTSLQLSVGMTQNGTLIQQECCLGPISYSAAQDYFKEKINCAKCDDLDADDKEQCSYFWIQAHGMSANYMRLLEQYISDIDQNANNDQKPNSFRKQQLGRAKNLAEELDNIWDFKDAWKFLNFMDTKNDVLNDRLDDHFWYRCFMHIGMLQYSHALLEGLDSHKSIHYLDPEKAIQKSLPKAFINVQPKIALVVGSPDLLRFLGQHLIFRHLEVADKISVNKEGPVRLK